MEKLNMIKSNLISVINEEINGFDFLGNDSYLKEVESLNTLSNEDMQKQFISDFLLKNNKIKITNVVESSLGGDWEERGSFNINYMVEIAYQYDSAQEPINFGLQFIGNNVQFSPSGDNYSEEWHDVSWDSFQVNMFAVGENDDDIEFKAFDRAPKNIQNLFIREFLADFIQKATGITVDKPN
jgi:hypothetical protein